MNVYYNGGMNVHYNGGEAQDARFLYNRLRKLPEKEANSFPRGKLRSMRASPWA